MCDVRTHAQEFGKVAARDIFAANIWGEGGGGASEKRFASLAVAWGGGGCNPHQITYLRKFECHRWALGMK